MSDNARDTQFKYFSECLMEEIDQINGRDIQSVEDEKEICQLIARRAYDLVEHALGYSLEYLDECGKEISGGMSKRIMPSIPDMTELPKEQEL